MDVTRRPVDAGAAVACLLLTVRVQLAITAFRAGLVD